MHIEKEITVTKNTSPDRERERERERETEKEREGEKGAILKGKHLLFPIRVVPTEEGISKWKTATPPPNPSKTSNNGWFGTSANQSIDQSVDGSIDRQTDDQPTNQSHLLTHSLTNKYVS